MLSSAITRLLQLRRLRTGSASTTHFQKIMHQSVEGVHKAQQLLPPLTSELCARVCVCVCVCVDVCVCVCVCVCMYV
jgi:hypothetical protein